MDDNFDDLGLKIKKAWENGKIGPALAAGLLAFLVTIVAVGLIGSFAFSSFTNFVATVIALAVGVIIFAKMINK